MIRQESLDHLARGSTVASVSVWKRMTSTFYSQGAVFLGSTDKVDEALPAVDVC